MSIPSSISDNWDTALFDAYCERQEEGERRHNIETFMKNISSVSATYTGGGIWVFLGKYKEVFFMADDDGRVYIYNEDPREAEDPYEMEWQNEHMIDDSEIFEYTTENVTDFYTAVLERLLNPTEQDNLGGITKEEIERYLGYEYVD